MMTTHVHPRLLDRQIQIALGPGEGPQRRETAQEGRERAVGEREGRLHDCLHHQAFRPGWLKPAIAR